MIRVNLKSGNRFEAMRLVVPELRELMIDLAILGQGTKDDH